MIKANYPQLEVDDLATVIQESIRNHATEPEHTTGNLFSNDSSRQTNSTSLNLQPDFQPRDSGAAYDLNDLLRFHDRVFVRNAYRAILGRHPTEAECAAHLYELHTGRRNKLDVLATLRFSAAGKARGVQIEGLQRRAIVRRLGQIPIIGYLFRLVITLARLPNVIRDQKQFEGYVLSQNQEIADFINRVSAQTSETAITIENIRPGTEKIAELEGLLRDLSANQRALAEHQETDRNNLYVKLQSHSSEAAKLLEKQKVDWAQRFESHRNALEKSLDELRRDLTDLDSQRQLSSESTIKKLGGEIERLKQIQSLTRAELTIQSTERSKPTNAKRMEVADKFDGLEALYAAVEDRFRGTRDEIKERFRYYLPYIKRSCEADDAQVLDLGCGRGEWLELLKEDKINARGVDMNRILLNQCREVGLDVVEDDVLSYLSQLDSESINAVTGFHIIEHLPISYLVQMLDQVMRILRPGGLALFETPNPENVLVGSNFFYFDPSHRHPLPGPLMELLLETRGFNSIEFMPLHPWDSGRVDGGGELADRFNGLFYGPMDYAILGWKMGA
jgi:O-antigen chain-terminating methyltransferase